MSNLVQSLLESANPYSDQLGVSQKLSKKWAKSGLLEGLKDYDRNNMAVILENQAKQLVMEQSSTGGNVTNGATFTPGNGEQWAGVALPLVRKIFGQIAAKEFVSVQPMNLPAGLVFYLDFQYGSSIPKPFQAGQSVYGNLVQTANSGFGNSATGGLYGQGRFGYSINQFSASYASGSVTAALATFQQVDFNSAYSQSIVDNKMVAITVPTNSLVLDTNGVRAFELSGSVNASITPATQISDFTVISGGNLVFFVSGSTLGTIQTSLSGSGDAAMGTTLFYNKSTNFQTRGDFEDAPNDTPTPFSNPNAASSASIVIPEINVQMKSETISAKTRKLKAQWTPEFAQDLNAYHSLDAEAELTGMLSEYISLEIDLEILDMLIENAQTVANWSAQIGNQINQAGTAYVSNTAGAYYNQMSWFQTLGIKLQAVSNKIHQLTLRGGANFLVCSPTVATILESIPGFAADTDGAADTMKYAFGVQKVGALNSRYKVYKNPYMTENTILMGFRGNQFLECGAVYAPYVPLIMTPLVYDPNTFTPRKGIMTRYAKKMIRPEYYGKVYVSDLQVAQAS
jgi:Major capsid protein Gp23